VAGYHRNGWLGMTEICNTDMFCRTVMLFLPKILITMTNKNNLSTWKKEDLDWEHWHPIEPKK